MEQPIVCDSCGYVIKKPHAKRCPKCNYCLTCN